MTEDVMKTEDENCPNCGGPIAIRNPTGKCDHLYYPENVPGHVSERSALLKCEEALRASKFWFEGRLSGKAQGGTTSEMLASISAALTLLDEVRK